MDGTSQAAGENGRYLTFDQTTWPNPDDPSGLEHRLRYEPRPLTQQDRYFLALLIDAYRTLIEMSAVERSQRVAALRAARDQARREKGQSR